MLKLCVKKRIIYTQNVCAFNLNNLFKLNEKPKFSYIVVHSIDSEKQKKKLNEFRLKCLP